MTNFTYNFPIIDDDVMEPYEVFTLVIASTDHPQVRISRRNSVRVNITDDDDRE